MVAENQKTNKPTKTIYNDNAGDAVASSARDPDGNGMARELKVCVYMDTQTL